jgi:hypothetical protein
LFLDNGHAEAWTLLTDTNPRRMIRGEAPLPVPPVRLGGSWLGRLLRR